MLVEKKKIKFKPSATSIAKEQETEPPSIHSTGVEMEKLGREGSITAVGAAKHEPGLMWTSSVTMSLVTAMPGGTALLAPGVPHFTQLQQHPKSQCSQTNSGNQGARQEQDCPALLRDAEQQQDPLLSPAAPW